MDGAIDGALLGWMVGWVGESINTLNDRLTTGFVFSVEWDI